MKRGYFLCLFTAAILPLFAQNQTVMIDGTPRDTSYTIYSAYQKLHKTYPSIAFVDETLPDGIIKKENITYKTVCQLNGAKRDLKLSVFRPKDARNYPVVMIIHGGGWSSGTREMMTSFAQNLSLKGFITVCVEYRLSPEALYPAGVDDLNDAVEWMFSNAGKYKCHKNKIAVAGFSAGGQLASLIGTKNRCNHIKAVVNVDGITTFVEKETIDHAEKAKREGGKMPADVLWLGGVYSEKPEIWEDASPLYWVNKKTAPVLFINGSIPRFHNGRDEFIKKLNRFGIYSEVYSFDNCPHNFWLFLPWHYVTVEKTAGFLQTILH
ncbi:MAG: alpha/beta hydrolase [Paludibacteraceae bacterium]